MSDLAHWRAYLRYRVFYPLSARLPRGLSYRCAGIAGVIDPDRRRAEVAAAARGLAMAFPDWDSAQCRATASALAAMMAREIMDVHWLDRLRAGNLSRFIRLEGLEGLQRIRAAGRPVILYSGHFGRLIMPAMALGVLGIPSSCLMADIRASAMPAPERSYMEFKIRSMQRLMGGEMIGKDEPYRRLYRTLRDVGVLILIVDAPPGPNDTLTRVPFLGGELSVAKGALRMARKTGAALVPYFTLEQTGALVGKILPEVEIADVDDDAAMCRLFAPLEREVIERPDHWWLWSALPHIWRPAPVSANIA